MPQFRKRPVEVEARQVRSDTIFDIADWCEGEVFQGEYIVISTLEGDMTADLMDWVIKGVHGEFYPCKPDIFDATYEPVDT